jgi:hypothetical protein
MNPRMIAFNQQMIKTYPDVLEYYELNVDGTVNENILKINLSDVEPYIDNHICVGMLNGIPIYTLDKEIGSLFLMARLEEQLQQKTS